MNFYSFNHDIVRQQKILAMLSDYIKMVKRERIVQEFVWEESEINNVKWQKTIADLMKAEGMIYKVTESGFTIEMP
jgi:hypothetical protein